MTGHIPKNSEQKKRIRSDAEKEVARLFKVHEFVANRLDARAMSVDILREAL